MLEKILYIANIRIPTEKAHGHQIMQMCNSFSRQIAVELVTPKRKNAITQSPFEYYDIPQSFPITTLAAYDPVWAQTLPAGWYIKLQAIMFIKKLGSYLKKNKSKSNLIYTRDHYLLPFLQTFGMNVVWEAHSLPTDPNKYALAFKKCSKIITVTATLKEQLIELGVPAENILVQHDAVDLNKFDIDISQAAAKAEFDLDQDKYILGYTGSFFTKNMPKGIDEIIQALAILPQDIPAYFVAIGGSLQDISHYNKVAKKYNVTNFKLLPKVDQEKLAKFQKACDLLLMPFPYKKHYALYMSPMKMFEYMASKVPIIATDLPSIKDVLNTQNSTLIPPDDVEQLAQAIVDSFHNREGVTKKAIQAYNDVQLHTWDKRAENIFKFTQF